MQQIFKLDGGNFSYIFGVDSNGRLRQLHFGDRLTKMPSCLTKDHTHAWIVWDAKAEKNALLDNQTMEFPSTFYYDFGVSPLSLSDANGHFIWDLEYHSHRYLSEKPVLEGLPSAHGKDLETLEITLVDQNFGLTVLLYYTVIGNVLCKSTKIINDSQGEFTLTGAYSSSLDIKQGDFEVRYLAGTWAKERHLQSIPVKQGRFEVSSNLGGSGHQLNPFVMVAEPNADQTHGKVFGFCPIYSGNHSTVVEKSQFGRTRILNGINPDGFMWKLAPGEAFYTPEIMLSFSSQGEKMLSDNFHTAILEHIIPENFKNKTSPVLINNWEATYFDFDEEKLVSIATKASEIGVELFVMDDGWFGKRDSDHCSLGDYTLNAKKLPNGLPHLVERINALGMQFGIWFEPEMVNEDSDLFRKHPEWRIEEPYHVPSIGRHQYILDLTNKEVQDYIVQQVSGILSSANITYVKWDMNRNMTSMPSLGFNHRFYLGLYSVMDRITKRFPHVLFEGCSGGGGRFDAGILSYMPQIWTSDDTDPIERLKIQYGTSLCYPLRTMGSHVTASPNHITGRITPLDTRFAVAMSGNFGYELDITTLPQSELDAMKEQIAFCKKYRDMVATCHIDRLVSPFTSNYSVLQMNARDGKTVLLVATKVLSTPNVTHTTFHLRSLEKDATYKNQEGECFSGEELMYMGYEVNFKTEDFTSNITIFEKI